jgi:hypothetical protein
VQRLDKQGLLKQPVVTCASSQHAQSMTAKLPQLRPIVLPTLTPRL